MQFVEAIPTPPTMSSSPATAVFPPVPALVTVPATPGELADEARRIHAESVHYWRAYPLEAFFTRPEPEVWAPADQVRHLTRAVRAVNKGLTLPRPVLVILFGWSRRPSRTFDVLMTDYKAVLTAGGRAGRFAPPAVPSTQQTTDGRERIMSLHAVAIDEFARAVERWTARGLERYRLPHPLLGKLTVREMVYFTLLHNVHHVQVAERRRRASGASDKA